MKEWYTRTALPVLIRAVRNGKFLIATGYFASYLDLHTIVYTQEIQYNIHVFSYMECKCLGKCILIVSILHLDVPQLKHLVVNLAFKKHFLQSWKNRAIVNLARII